VEKGLKLLKDHGFRLVTLTNSPPHALKQQLINSNLTEYFEQALSIDSLKKYKPEVATYLWAAKELAVKPKEILMIAAHGWDLAGASHAGLATCFIAREGQSVYTLSNKPDFEANDILAMAEQLVTAHSE
jgi:2-haloacid dehalogenase